MSMTQTVERVDHHDDLQGDVAEQATSRGELVHIAPPRLPYHPAVQDRFNIDKSGWRVLIDATFPSAKSVEAILMALAYCKSRNLDVFKRPVHVVPMWSSAAGRMVETVWPSIAELRTTAFRTKQYAGIESVEWGPVKKTTFAGTATKGKIAGQKRSVALEYPEWCRITILRELNGKERKFIGPKVLFTESYATWADTDVPNDMWSERPEGQLEKCAEAAALRRAFPEEIGNDLTAEEMEGRRLYDPGANAKDVTPREEPPAPPPPPAQIAAPTEPAGAPPAAPEPEKDDPPPPEPEPEPTGKPEAAAGSSDDGLDIPPMLDRRKQQAAKAAEKPVSDTPPDWNKSLQAFLEWTDAVLGKVSDPDFLERTFNERVQPHTKGMFPPDEDEVLAVYTKHERRLGIG